MIDGGRSPPRAPASASHVPAPRIWYTPVVEFDWMTPKRPAIDPQKRLAMYKREVADRAGMFYRLGYSTEEACSRLLNNADWDFEIGAGVRPEELDAEAIANIVAATYARRPSH